jgi:hypothetical protein
MPFKRPIENTLMIFLIPALLTLGDVNLMSVIGGIGVPSISGSCPGGSLVNTEVY